MPYIEYERWRPNARTKDLLVKAENICREYDSQGYNLTLRQLYYQFVARGYIENKEAEYSRLGNVVNRGRLAGFLDWDYIVDRTRNLRLLPHWANPSEIIAAVAQSFRQDKWEEQPVRVEVWVEKEALAGVIERAANRHDVSWFSCRGYVSTSELWRASQRFQEYIDVGQRVLVLYLGDHDPSGIDMTRDIQDRLWQFARSSAECVRRIALNMDQIEKYRPPPNPAKITDSRAESYIEVFGPESWELDALDPKALETIIEEHILGELDSSRWKHTTRAEAKHRELLKRASGRWQELVSILKEKPSQ